jgi:DNA-binding response OmpR family regulator
MQHQPKLLLVEDDRQLSQTLAEALKSVYEVDVARNGKLGIYKTDTNDYDLLILDLNLPDISGLDVCQQLRHRGVQAPILILSGETKVLTKINLLDAGASDYLTKPFILGELLARLRAISRLNPQPLWPSLQLDIGEVSLNRRTYIATRSGIELKLRRKEFELLACLMEDADSLVTRQHLINRVWRDRGDVWANTIDVHIKYLRDKLDKPFNSSLIETVHGMGYKFVSKASKLKQPGRI